MIQRADYTGKSVVISGVRKPDADGVRLIESVVLDMMQAPPERVIIGGAMGADTIAFTTAAKALRSHLGGCQEIVLIVPATLKDCPAAFRAAVESSHLPLYVMGDEPAQGPFGTLVEMYLDPADPGAYHARNRFMLETAQEYKNPRLLAFLGKQKGGTFNTIGEALRRSIPTDTIAVKLA
jgi:hypothetical protein